MKIKGAGQRNLLAEAIAELKIIPKWQLTESVRRVLVALDDEPAAPIVDLFQYRKQKDLGK